MTTNTQEKKTITLYELIQKVKLYEKKLFKASCNPFIEVYTEEYPTKKDELEVELKANYQSYISLTEQWLYYKLLLEDTNCNTKVEFNGIEFTIRELLAYRDYIIPHRLKTIENIDGNLARFHNKLNMANNAYEQQKAIFASDKDLTPETLEAIDFLARGKKPEIVDPNGMLKTYMEWRENVMNEKQEIDTLLNLINVRTDVEIEV